MPSWANERSVVLKAADRQLVAGKPSGGDRIAGDPGKVSPALRSRLLLS
jgi:hypothetical protein